MLIHFTTIYHCWPAQCAPHTADSETRCAFAVRSARALGKRGVCSRVLQEGRKGAVSTQLLGHDASPPGEAVRGYELAGGATRSA